MCDTVIKPIASLFSTEVLFHTGMPMELFIAELCKLSEAVPAFKNAIGVVVSLGCLARNNMYLLYLLYV